MLSSWLKGVGWLFISWRALKWWEKTPCAFVMDCIALRICLVLSLNTDPHTAHAAFRSAQTWMFERGDAPLQHIWSATVQELLEFSFLIACLFNNHKQNDFDLFACVCRWRSQTFFFNSSLTKTSSVEDVLLLTPLFLLWRQRKSPEVLFA